MTPQAIAPFFEPGAPPLIQPLLTSQTDLSYLTYPSPTIITHEELNTTKVQSQSIPWSASCAHSQPYTKPPTKHVKVPWAQSSSLPADAASELSELSDLTSDTLSRSISPAGFGDQLIPKPTGEPRCPGCSGYNLKKALGWKAESFAKLQVFGLPLMFTVISC